ncbi:cytochrome P450 [Stachybotrys elegans]|uniref:Cytochrome P450 n=1 Tax=Stachybotrys elegans TaxID=80388 RepID=A0A8K0T544_9HYPO|nr:cytochrome P450 [Stachybotrys elegans]
MVSVLSIAAASFLTWTSWCAYHLRRNLVQARTTGLSIVISPFSPNHTVWMVLRPVVLPIIKALPFSRDADFIPILDQEWGFNTGYSLFAKHGEMFVIVSPGRNLAVCCNAEVVQQMSVRKDHFPKDLATYDILRPFGDNILTTEGKEWRMHRKASAPAFNERNMAMVFHEATRQAQSMIKTWTGPGGNSTATLRTLQEDAMRIALHVISFVGFGVALLWPGETLAEDMDPKLAKYASPEPLGDHVMSFADALEKMLDYILLILIFPDWMLRYMPWKQGLVALTSRNEFYKYTNELVDEKSCDLGREEGGNRKSMDLMGQLLLSSLAEEKQKGGRDLQLGRNAVISNTFLMLVAGHETAANVLHFTLIELANNPAAQRRLQKEVDEITGGRDPSSWNYEALVKPLMGSMVMACLNETMRMVPPVVAVPKKVTSDQDQVLTMDGKEFVIPRDLVIMWKVVCIHRNPRYWPTMPSKIHPGKDDVNDWVADRWFRTTPTAEKTSEQVLDEADDMVSYEDPDKGSSALFQPERGAYLPFSDGARGCLGKRMAQVEMLAIMAVIFQKYSIELAVDDWATDDEVRSMSRAKKAELYRTAQDRSRATTQTAVSVLSLKLQEGQHIPVRLVRRGEEQFVNWIDGEEKGAP